MFSACSIAKLVKKYAPSIRYKSLKFKSIDLQGFTLELALSINNDKVNKKLVIVKNDYSVFIEGKHLVKVKNNESVELPPNKNVDYKQDINIKYKDAMGILQDLFKKDRVAIKIKGTFYVNAAGKQVKVPLEKTFNVKVPEFPEISLANIRFTGLNRIVLQLKITNRMPISVAVSRSKFSVYVSGQDLLNAQTGKINLDQNKSTIIRVPVTFNIVKAVGIIAKLKNWKKLKVNLKGYFEIDTPLKKIKIPFEL